MRCGEFDYGGFVNLILEISSRSERDAGGLIEKFCQGGRPGVAEYLLHFQSCRVCFSKVNENAERKCPDGKGREIFYDAISKIRDYTDFIN